MILDEKFIAVKLCKFVAMNIMSTCKESPLKAVAFVSVLIVCCTNTTYSDTCIISCSSTFQLLLRFCVSGYHLIFHF